MKKNVMMRIASVLLVAVMLTTCVISGTFAKYVTSNDGSDSARVAKWGVTVSVGGNMFADAYATDDTTLSAEAQAIIGTNSVVTSGAADDSLVAPGTDGEMATITLSGTPEVAVEVTYDATVTLSDWLIDINNTPSDDTDDVFYCPLIFTVASTVIDARTLANAGEVKTALENAIEAYSAYYAANEDLSTHTVTIPVSWEWDFDDAGAGTYDTKDTLLGDKAVTDADTIAVAVVVTVEQVD